MLQINHFKNLIALRYINKKVDMYIYKDYKNNLKTFKKNILKIENSYKLKATYIKHDYNYFEIL